MTIIKTIKNSFLRPLLLNFKRIKGKHYNKEGSPHIKFLDNEKIILLKLVNKYLNKEIKILNIGAGSKTGRRCNLLGGKMINVTDSVKKDILGGWLENWVVMHVGRKLN